MLEHLSDTDRLIGPIQLANGALEIYERLCDISATSTVLR